MASRAGERTEDRAGTRRWRVSACRSIPLDRPRIIAVLNVTPDSFHGESRLSGARAAADAAERAAQAGADALDVGGESTRPGAERVAADEQIRRVVPAIEAIRARRRTAEIPITVDTTLAAVASRGLDAGADAINDVSAGREDPDLLELAASRGAGLVIMHRLRPPGEDAYSDRYDRPPEYEAVVEVVARFLEERAAAAEAAGVVREGIVIDPGLGFGKSVEQNLALIRGTDRLGRAGYPVLSALSRKSFVGRAGLGRDSAPSERLPATLGLSVVHRLAGAALFRVHDVAEHVQALRAVEAAHGAAGPVARGAERE